MSDFNKGHIPEAMDRTSIICSNIDDHLLGHPAVKKHPEIEALILKGQSLLAEAYQALGVIWSEDRE